MSAVADARDLMIRASLATDEWDELPMIALVGEENVVLVALAADDDIDLPIMVAQLAIQIASGQFTDLPANTSGAVLMTEAWGLSSKIKDKAKITKEIDKLKAEGKRFSDHPDAVECKLFMSIDKDGIEGFRIERGAGEAHVIAVEEGRLVNALGSILEAVSPL